MMNFQEQYSWIIRGYRDAEEKEPYKRAPDLPEEALCLCKEQPLDMSKANSLPRLILSQVDHNQKTGRKLYK